VAAGAGMPFAGRPIPRSPLGGTGESISIGVDAIAVACSEDPVQ
jgi:hypothetical protein